MLIETLNLHKIDRQQAFTEDTAILLHKQGIIVADSSQNNSFIESFRQCSPYINAHRHKTVVIYLGSQALRSTNMTRIAYDIALLNSLGVRIILTIGTRQLIDQAMSEASLEKKLHNGLRITDQNTLDIAQRISGQYRFQLEATFSSALPNTPMHGANIQLLGGNLVAAKPLGVIDGVDFQYSASVKKINAKAINDLLDHDAIVLLSNIAHSATGECFNVRAEEVAVATATALKADKYIVYSSDSQLTSLPQEILLDDAQQQIGKAPFEQANIQSLINACDAGIERCHMISFEQDGALLSELFTTDGSGVLISKNPFESIRQATRKDIPSLLQLLTPLQDDGVLVSRDNDKLEQSIEHYYVIERDQRIIACAALEPFGDMAEIASVATDKDYQGSKKASELLQFLEKQAKTQEFSNVFVLTTQTAHFFLEQGFTHCEISNLPEAKQQLLDNKRQSKAFIKTLA